MKVISTNIGEAQTVSWNGKDIKTGIYKYPVDEAIFLDTEDVKGDHVIDRRYHGGLNKACYLYAADHYSYWKQKYPKLDWSFGMFGENLTVLGLDEKNINIGDTYQIGNAVVQVSQPRRPCFKLGIRFGSQDILMEFIEAIMPGIYLRVLEKGKVRTNDTFTIKEKQQDGISVHDLFVLLHYKSSYVDLAKKAIENPFVTSNNKASILKKYGSSIAK